MELSLTDKYTHLAYGDEIFTLVSYGKDKKVDVKHLRKV